MKYRTRSRKSARKRISSGGCDANEAAGIDALRLCFGGRCLAVAAMTNCLLSPAIGPRHGREVEGTATATGEPADGAEPCDRRTPAMEGSLWRGAWGCGESGGGARSW